MNENLKAALELIRDDGGAFNAFQRALQRLQLAYVMSPESDIGTFVLRDYAGDDAYYDYIPGALELSLKLMQEMEVKEFIETFFTHIEDGDVEDAQDLKIMQYACDGICGTIHDLVDGEITYQDVIARAAALTKPE